MNHWWNIIILEGFLFKNVMILTDNKCYETIVLHVTSSSVSIDYVSTLQYRVGVIFRWRCIAGCSEGLYTHTYTRMEPQCMMFGTGRCHNGRVVHYTNTRIRWMRSTNWCSSISRHSLSLSMCTLPTPHIPTQLPRCVHPVVPLLKLPYIRACLLIRQILHQTDVSEIFWYLALLFLLSTI